MMYSQCNLLAWPVTLLHLLLSAYFTWVDRDKSNKSLQIQCLTESSVMLSLPPHLYHCRAKLLVVSSEHLVLAICLPSFHSSLLQFLLTAKWLLYKKYLATTQNFNMVCEIFLLLWLSEDNINISLTGKDTSITIRSVFIGKWQHLSFWSIGKHPQQ